MVGGVVLLFVDRNASLSSFAQSWKLSTVLDAVVNLGTPALGVLLVLRRPENRIGWLFLLVGLVLGLDPVRRRLRRARASRRPWIGPGREPGRLDLERALAAPVERFGAPVPLVPDRSGPLAEVAAG
jgi:hypothetical protein